MANNSKPVIAAFDFDGTLTQRDSLLPFLHSVCGTSTTLKNLFLEIPALIQYLRNSLDRQGLKESFLTRFLKGKTRQELQQSAERYAHQILPKMVKSEGLHRIAWHKNQGHRCILVSANLEIYLEPWGLSTGFDDIIASCLEFSPEDRATGHLKGLNCRGAEKVRRLTALAGPKNGYILYAYGDSAGDKELLDFADHSFFCTLR